MATKEEMQDLRNFVQETRGVMTWMTPTVQNLEVRMTAMQNLEARVAAIEKNNTTTGAAKKKKLTELGSSGVEQYGGDAEKYGEWAFSMETF